MTIDILYWVMVGEFVIVIWLLYTILKVLENYWISLVQWLRSLEATLNRIERKE